MTSALVSDAEFDRLVASQPHVFAVRARAQSVASELRPRAASVAVELRQMIVAGEAADLEACAWIANRFDHLARELENEVREPDFTGWRTGRYATRASKQPKLEDYEIGAWWAEGQPAQAATS